MFVNCHITFGQPSNFVGASLEVTRTIRNNKLHFTWGWSILLLKKRKRALRLDSFFFLNDSDIFISNLILIITSLAILYSQNVFRGFSILVCIGVQVFVRVSFFSTPPLARDSPSRLPRTCLRLTEKCWKITPVMQIQASSMKLRVYDFPFLVFLHIKTNGQNKLFFITTSTFR